MLRAVKLTLVPVTNLKQPVTVGILISLCKLCDALHDVGKVFKCLFCLAFFSLLRQSNLLVSKGARDNQLMVLRRCDVVVAHPGLRLLLRGTKTLLAGGRHGFIPIPAIPDSPICPVAALSDMLCVLPPAPPSAPLFLLPGVKMVPLSRSRATSVLRCLLNSLGVQASCFTLHSFRKGGATLAFAAGMDLDLIKALGTWRSDAVWSYLSLNGKRIEAAQRLGQIVHAAE